VPSARNIRAGAAYVELYTHDNRLVKGLRNASRRLKAFSASVRQIGVQLAKVSAVFATPLIAGVKIFADFEQQMANVSTMLDEPDKHMGRFRQGIRDMSVEFGESTETLAKGLYDILSASVPAEHALSVLAAAAKAAQAGITDTGTAADAITTVLNAYGLSAEQAGDVSDWLFSIVKRGKTTFAELAPSIGNVATIAATAGVGLDEAGAALATMTRNGVQTENAVTALNAIISSFLKPVSEATEYARQLGFEMSSATIRSEGLAGVFGKISKLPPDAISKLFPNIRALKGVLPALKNMEGFTEDIAVMADRAGATEVAYKKMTGTLAHGFRQIKQSAIVALSVVGEALAEPVARIARTVKAYTAHVRRVLEKNKAMVVSAAKVVAVTGLVGGALIAIGVAGAAMSFVFGGIASIITGVGTAIGVLGSVLAALLSPIGLVTAGVVGLAVGILHATGAGVKALGWLGERFEALKQTALKAWQGIGDAMAAGNIALAAKILWLTLKLEWQRGVHALRGYWTDFKTWFLTLATDAFYGAVGLLAEAWAGLQAIWVETTTFLANTWTRFTSGLTKAWNSAENLLTKGWLKLMGLFDEDLDVEAAIRMADEDLARRNAQVEREAQRTLAEREQQRKQKREAIEQERIGTLRAIDEMADAENEARKQRYADQLKASEDALAKARTEWQAAIAEAGAQRAEAKEGEGPEKPENVADRIKKMLAGVTDAIGQADVVTRGMSTAGTFNALAAFGLGTGNVAERTAKATEETARNTAKIARKAGQELLFA